MSPYLKVEAPGGGQAVKSEVAADIGDEGTVKWAGPVELSGDSGSPIKVVMSCSTQQHSVPLQKNRAVSAFLAGC